MPIKISKEFWIGLVVVVSIVLLFFGLNFLKGVNIFNPSNYFYAKFANVNGLTESAEVFVHGKKVGLVRSIDYDYDHPNSDVVVMLQVDSELKLPVGSRAVMNVGLMGGATISLEPTLNADMSMLYAPGDTLPTYVPVDMLTAISDKMLPRIEQIIPQLDSLLVSLNTLVGNKDISASLHHINRLTGNLESASASLNKMLSNDLPPILSDAKHITGNFSKVSDNLNGVDFAATMKKVDNTLNDFNAITTKINKGEGSLGLLMNDRKLYDGLNTTVNSANELMVDLKTNPKRYVHFSFISKEKKE